MKYTTEKILLMILSLEIIATIFVGCFYHDLYQSTVNGKTRINEYGQVIHTKAHSWSVSLISILSEMEEK